MLALWLANSSVRRWQQGHGALIDRIDSLLPQTQCGDCGFAGCQPYAQAIARQLAPINRCPPGGNATVRDIAQLLGRPIPAFTCADDARPQVRTLRIVEEDCIGCAKCLPHCPVDAIVGARGQLHMIVSERCTGCDLCVQPCPVDCIVPDAPTLPLPRWPSPIQRHA